MRVPVDAFEIEQHSVTNGAYLEYMTATGAKAPHFWVRKEDQWFWRGMFELIPLPLDWPVWVTYDEAAAYARWNGGRIASEGEYNRAAEGTPPTEGNLDFRNFDPVAAGSYPKAVSTWGVNDLVGNGWEWTSTVFDGFPGFQPMPSYPQYSADFFDGKHRVLKGASPVTAQALVRLSFRNWFRPNYPYVFAKFRCVW
jgi:formylglycine-generating enzyme required for sulfatase activity